MGPFFSPELFRLALPIMLSQAGQMLMGMVDAWVIGRVSAAALGGVGLGNSIISALMFGSLGITLSLDTKIPQAWGAKKPKQALLYLSQGIWLSIRLGVPFAGVGLAVAWLLPHFGVQPEIAIAAQPFVGWVALSIPFFLIFIVFQRYWLARGIANPGMYILILANLVNLALNLILVPSLHTAGTGLATLVSRVFMVVCLVAYSVYREPMIRLKLDRLRRRIQKNLIHDGLPITGQLLLEIGIFTLATFLAARIGITEGAAHHLVLMLASFTFMFPLGIGSATSMLVGNALGAKDIPGSVRAGWQGIQASVSVMVVCGLILWIFGGTIVSWFTQDLAVIQLASKVMIVAALFQVFDGIQVTATGALRGAGETRQSMWANLLGHYPVGLVLGYFFCFHRQEGLIGLWIGLATGLLVVAILLLAAWKQKAVALLVADGR